MNIRLKVVIKLIPVMSITFLIAGIVNAKEYKVYYMGGQSNMDGFGLNSELPKNFHIPPKNVFIFHGNASADGTILDGKGVWQKVKPGHGRGFSSDETQNYYGDKFGPELSFAHLMSKKYPDDNIAIIKYSKGGTSIDCKAARDFGCWEVDFSDKNGINQYDHYLATIKNAFAISDIDGDGENDILVPHGILWMQGESDALMSKEIALAYEKNLSSLIAAFRASLNSPILPVVIGQISDSGQDDDGKVWDFGDIVKDAQSKFVDSDPNASLVDDTNNYQYSDRHHYDTKSYIDLGQRFAESLIEFEKHAMVAFEMTGMIEIRSGSRIYATDAKSMNQIPLVDAGIGPFEILEIRLIIESEACALAARSYD